MSLMVNDTSSALVVVMAKFPLEGREPPDALMDPP